MKTSRLLTLAVSSYFLVSVSAARASDPVRVIVGGPGTVALMNKVKGEFEKSTGITVDITVNPVDAAFGAMVAGNADAVGALDVEDMMLMAEKRGTPKQNINDFESITISEVKIKAGVHPSNPVEKITHEQSAEILSGKIKNWKSITGKDLPLTVLMAKKYVGTMKHVLKHYTGSDQSDVPKYVLDKEGTVRGIERDPGAIGYFNIEESTPTFKPKYLPTDAVIQSKLIIKKSARPEARKFFEFMRSKGVLQG